MTIVIGLFATCLLVVPFALLGFVRMAQARGEAQRRADLEINGAPIDGTVTHFQIKPVRGGAICTVTYRYEVEGKPYQSLQEVGKDHILARDTHVKVLCLPHSPQIAMLTGEDWDDTRRTRTSRLAIFFFTIALLLLILTPIMASIASMASPRR